ncbi:MAG: beta-galactosidase [Candidatus Marinimicrobia bacterium]|nr:beta-galactosidase [Candidatus Neomarinimicrobiota bacterium]
MQKIEYLILICTIVLFSCHKNISTIDLSGKWKFQIDTLDNGLNEKWFKEQFKETVNLPGSMATNNKGFSVDTHTKWTGYIVDQSWFTDNKYAKYRKTGNIKIPFWLQPEKYYVGPAWYQKEVAIPKSWQNNSVELILERCHWESIVWVNDKKVGSSNRLGTAHHYDLTNFLSAGKNQITIRIDNRIKEIDPGISSHSVSDHTQSNWNGIVGDIQLKSEPAVHFTNVQVYPNIREKTINVEVQIRNLANQAVPGNLNLKIMDRDNKVIMDDKRITMTIDKGENIIQQKLFLGDSVEFWSEFNPKLYQLFATLNTDKGLSKQQVDFGMRELGTEGTQITVNGQKSFFRGTLECAIFPKTGYPAMEASEWERIYQICKSFGLNHMRFHSWCPPKAAFEAADKVGFYLQIECSSWANQGASIGDHKPLDQWLYKEADAILEEYGNHPSFCFMSYGNEPAGQFQGKYLTEFIKFCRDKDSRHLYTSAGGWPIIDENDFHSSPSPRIQGWGEELNSIINSEPPNTQYDWYHKIKDYQKPVISHEIGQWCVYPDFKEIEKYTGPLKAKNFEIFKETLEASHLGHLSDSFLLASGKLQTLCYKADIEAALRTSGFAGFQLLDLHDFPGQGTALVGVLNAFWEEKGYVTAEEYSRFCNVTVPLARMEKRIFLSNENFVADLEIAHFGQTPIKNASVKWEIWDKNKVLQQGYFNQSEISIGNCQKIGRIQQDLSEIPGPVQYQLKVTVNDYQNDWDFWVYPASLPKIDGDKILVATALNHQVYEKLQSGGKVLFTPSKGQLKDEYGGSIGIGFSSIFWNTAWTRGQKPHTLGILCHPNHPAFEDFPTDYHSNWQWWDAMTHANAIDMKELSPDLAPIVRVIDDWFENRPLALLYEVRIGKGKMIVSGIDLTDNLDNRPEARQLRFSLEKYMASAKFNPIAKVDFNDILKMYKKD